MKNIGIWIDKKEAKIVSIENGQEQLNTIASQVEDFQPSGGSGTRMKGGPQDVVQDSKFLERERHQLADYFKEVVSNIQDAKSIVIFGPAQTGQKLHKEIHEKHTALKDKVNPVEKADNMTDNQIKAWVREYFGPE